MEYRNLGTTGIKVSKLCFGTMSFGGDADEATSAALYARCREVGINFFDCANTYAGGKSEEILGRLIAHERDQVIITSKVYFPLGAGENNAGASRRNILRAAEASLKRLNTDFLDIYFIHHFDDTTPLEDSLRALDTLVRQGKVMYIGASNFAAWQIMKGLGISARAGLAAFSCLQPMYNLVKRQAEVEILPMAQAEGLGVISYSPLGGGLLTGKYAAAQPLEQARLVTNKMYRARYGEAGVAEAAANFAAFARQHNVDPAGLAVAWVTANPAVTAPILGARNIQQLEGSLSALNIDMTPELYAEISRLTPQPPPATDRNDERTGDSWAVRK